VVANTISGWLTYSLGVPPILSDSSSAAEATASAAAGSLAIVRTLARPVMPTAAVAGHGSTRALLDHLARIVQNDTTTWACVVNDAEVRSIRVLVEHDVPRTWLFATRYGLLSP
jgi:hypothetical protein